MTTDQYVQRALATIHDAERTATDNNVTRFSYLDDPYQVAAKRGSVSAQRIGR